MRIHGRAEPQKQALPFHSLSNMNLIYNSELSVLFGVLTKVLKYKKESTFYCISRVRINLKTFLRFSLDFIIFSASYLILLRKVCYFMIITKE